MSIDRRQSKWSPSFVVDCQSAVLLHGLQLRPLHLRRQCCCLEESRSAQCCSSLGLQLRPLHLRRQWCCLEESRCAQCCSSLGLQLRPLHHHRQCCCFEAPQCAQCCSSLGLQLRPLHHRRQCCRSEDSLCCQSCSSRGPLLSSGNELEVQPLLPGLRQQLLVLLLHRHLEANRRTHQSGAFHLHLCLIFRITLETPPQKIYQVCRRKP